MVRHPLIIAIAACLAATSTWVSAQELEWIYSVRPDDTVAAICDRYTKEPACASKLPAYNKLSLDREPAAGRVLRIPVSWMKLAPVAATVSSVQGQAFHVHDDGTKTALEENQLLRLGDRVVAEQNSLTIKYPDATVIVLQEGSQLELTSVSAYTQKRGLTAEVYLRTGSLRARVPRHDVRTRFRVRTPAAVAAVRGTEFRVDASELGNGKILAREEVLEGVIAVSTDEHADKDIPMGFGLKVQEGAPPPKDLKKLPPAPAWADKQDGPVIVREYPYTLSWSKLPKVTGYRFEMYEDNSNEVMLLAHNTTANSYRLNDVAQGCYRVQVHGIDKEDFHGLNAVRRLCLKDHLPAPDLLFAEGQPVDQSIAWQPSENAAAYRVEVSHQRDFAKSVAVDQQANAFEMASLDLAQLGVAQDHQPLYVRVKAVHEDGGESVYSDIRRVGTPQIHDNWKWLFSGLLMLLAL